MKHLSLLCTLLLIASPLFAQSLHWNTTIEDAYSFSSPRATDLNGDGVLDIVAGAGIEPIPTDNGVVALNGVNGDVFWTVGARDQIFGSAIFQDISGDGIDDVFIGGRAAELMAINGLSGDIIWEYFPQGDTVDPADSGLFNFYTPQWVADQNGDNFLDLLITNGGDKSIPSFDTIRPPGQVMLISGLDGDLIASLPSPDGKEVYCSPVVHDFFQDGNHRVIFGSGGETISGSLWSISLSDLMNENSSGFQSIISSPDKGYIAPPSLADLNGDNVLEIIVNGYDGKITAYNLVTQSNLWQVIIENGETNASPAIGNYNNDGIPDVFCNYGVGVAPTFNDFVQVMIDGATGEVQWEDNLGLTQFGSPLSIDWNGDGDNEVLMSINDLQDGGGFQHELVLIDFNPASVLTVWGALPGANPVSTPWIGNLNNGSDLNLVYSYNLDDANFISESGFQMARLNLNIPASAPTPWCSYLGTAYDAVYINPFNNCANSDFDINTNITHNTCSGDTNGYAEVISSGCPNPALCIYEWSNDSTGHSISNMPAGVYTVTITHLDGCVRVAEVEILAPELSIEVTHVTCTGNNDGYAEVMGLDPNRTYDFDWSNNEFVYFIHGLSAGPYSVIITDDLGCSDFLEIEVLEPEPLELDHDMVDVSCYGQADGGVFFLADGGTEPYGYWLDGILYDTPLIQGLDTGEHYLMLEDAQECLRFDTISITQPDSLILNSNITDVTCFAAANGIAANSFTGGTEPYLVTWAGTAFGPLFANNYYRPNLDTGTYVIEILDANDCYVSNTINITQPEELSLDLSQTPESWNGANDGTASVAIDGGTSPYTIQWNTDPTQSTPTIENLNSQSYTLSVTDSLGCQKLGSIFVDLVTGIEDVDLEGVEILYNNLDQYLDISVPESSSPLHLKIFDLSGRQLLTQSLAPNTSHKISVNSFSAQLFLLEISSESGEITKKLLSH